MPWFFRVTEGYETASSLWTRWLGLRRSASKAARQKPRRSASRKRFAFRPGLEQLEDRIYALGLKSANHYGFVTIKQLMDEANAALANPGSFSRDYLETLKKALDAANNNLNFVL